MVFLVVVVLVLVALVLVLVALVLVLVELVLVVSVCSPYRICGSFILYISNSQVLRTSGYIWNIRVSIGSQIYPSQ